MCLQFLVLRPALAGRVILKSGKEISGTIINKNLEFIEVLSEGKKQKYCLEDVLEIRGNKPKFISADSAFVPGGGNSEELFKEAIRAASESNFLYAEEIFKKIGDTLPGNNNVGQALNIIDDLRNGKIKSSFAVYLFKGAYYLLEERYGEAIEIYEKALAIAPKSQEIYYNLGVACQALEKHQEAIKYFTELNKLNPEDLDAVFDLGISYYYLKEYQKAVFYLENFVIKDSQVPEVYSLLGLSYYAVGKHADARKAISKAKELYSAEGNQNAALELDLLL